MPGLTRGAGFTREVAREAMNALVEYLTWRANHDRGTVMTIRSSKVVKWYERHIGRDGLDKPMTYWVIGYVLRRMVSELMAIDDYAGTYGNAYVIPTAPIRELARTGKLRTYVEKLWVGQ